MVCFQVITEGVRNQPKIKLQNNVRTSRLWCKHINLSRHT